MNSLGILAKKILGLGPEPARNQGDLVSDLKPVQNRFENDLKIQGKNGGKAFFLKTGRNFVWNRPKTRIGSQFLD